MTASTCGTWGKKSLRSCILSSSTGRGTVTRSARCHESPSAPEMECVTFLVTVQKQLHDFETLREAQHISPGLVLLKKVPHFLFANIPQNILWEKGSWSVNDKVTVHVSIEGCLTETSLASFHNSCKMFKIFCISIILMCFRNSLASIVFEVNWSCDPLPPIYCDLPISWVDGNTPIEIQSGSGDEKEADLNWVGLIDTYVETSRIACRRG